MKRFAIFTLLIVLAFYLHGQDKIRPLLWFGPADDVSVYGVNISPIVYKLPENSVVNGINIEGVGIPILLLIMPFDPAKNGSTENIQNDFNVNGISISPAGLLHHGTVNGVALTSLFSFIDQVNGLQLSPLFNTSYRNNGLVISIDNSTVELNGVQIGLFNRAETVKGVQIGIINRAVFINGLQVGLWNVNYKRKLPIVNW